MRDKKEKLINLEKAIRQFNKKNLYNIAVIIKDNNYLSEIKRNLSHFKKIDEIDLESLTYEGGEVVIPVALSKGMEFDAVIIYDSENYRAESDPSDSKLLYVACTRALHELMIL